MRVRLPARTLSDHAPSADLLAALDCPAPTRSALAEAAATVILALPSRADVETLRPDFARLQKLDAAHLGAVIATAPGDGSSEGGAADYVFRYFTPWHGTGESAFAGSAHSTLAPLWSAHLRKSDLRARQLAGSGVPSHVCPGEAGGVWIARRSRPVRRRPLAEALR